MISYQSEQLVNFTNFSVFSYPRLELGKEFLLKIVKKKKQRRGEGHKLLKASKNPCQDG